MLLTAFFGAIWRRFSVSMMTFGNKQHVRSSGENALLSNCCFAVRQRNACSCLWAMCAQGSGEFDQIISMKLQIVKTPEAVKVTKR